MAGRMSLVVAGGALTAGFSSSCGTGGGTALTHPGCRELDSWTDGYGNSYRELSCDSYLYDYGADCYLGYSGVEYVRYFQDYGYDDYGNDEGYYRGEGGYYRYTGRTYRCTVYERAT